MNQPPNRDRRELSLVPECAACGQQETTWVDAAAHVWRRILTKYYCRACSGAFPVWMHEPF